MTEMSAGPPESVYYDNKEKKVSRTVVCILCDSAYYVSDFIKKKNGKFISKLLVVCHKHDNSVLTSKVDESILCDNARVLIAQLKAINKDEAKKQLCEDIFNETSKTNHNTTILNQEAEMETLVVENTLLKELNIELSEKIQLLKEKNIQDNSIINRVSYAQVTAQDRIVHKRIPKIVIKSTSENDSIDQVSNKITNILFKGKSIKTKLVKKKDNDKLVINCINSESVDRTLTVIKDKLKNSYTVEKESFDNPKMKLVGIDNSEDFDDKVLEDDINLRIFENFDNKCKILHSYINPKNKLKTVILEMPGDIHKFVKSNYGKICIAQTAQIFAMYS